MALGVALLGVSFSKTMWGIRLGCIIVGLGAGTIPTGIGILGDRDYFDLGICLVGIMIMCGFILLHYLRFPDE